MARDKNTLDALADAFIETLTKRVKDPVATAAELEIIRKVCNEAGIKWVPNPGYTNKDLEVPGSILDKLPFQTGKDGEVLIDLDTPKEEGGS